MNTGNLNAESFDDFSTLNDMASDLRSDIEDLVSTVDEYGEIIDDDFEDEMIEDTTLNTEDENIAIQVSPSTQNPNAKGNSWLKRSYLATNETDREFELFKIYCIYSGGRSLQYIQTVSNVPLSTISKISSKNNWKLRVEDYDRAQLVQKMKQAQTSRHELHIRKLEKYREEQEALGKQLTLNAARIALIANSTLCKMLDENKEVDTRDLPGLLNVAAKLADVGKNLQSSSLGVDNLLAALEESEG